MVAWALPMGTYGGIARLVSWYGWGISACAHGIVCAWGRHGYVCDGPYHGMYRDGVVMVGYGKGLSGYVCDGVVMVCMGSGLSWCV